MCLDLLNLFIYGVPKIGAVDMIDDTAIVFICRIEELPAVIIRMRCQKMRQIGREFGTAAVQFTNMAKMAYDSVAYTTAISSHLRNIDVIQEKDYLAHNSLSEVKVAENILIYWVAQSKKIEETTAFAFERTAGHGKQSITRIFK